MPPARTPPLPLTWPAALFGLAFGVAMTYAPYEFHSPFFRPLYPYVRALGLGYVASSIILMATMLYPRAPRWLDVLGRVAYGAVTGLYWWVVNVRTGGATGILLYPLLLAGLALEAAPAWRKREVFRGVVALIALSFGVTMLAAREHFPPVFYAALAPVLVPMGLVFLGAGLGLLTPLESRWPQLPRLLFGLLALDFSLLAWGLGRIGSGPGAGIYLILTLSCGAVAAQLHPRAPRTVGFKLLRGLAFAGLVPMLALGGFAAYLAQGAIERQVRDDTVSAARGEVDFLMRYQADASESLKLLRKSPGFHEAFLARDRALLERHLRNLTDQPDQASVFHAVLAVDRDGVGLASSEASSEPPGDFAHRDFYTGVRSTHAPYVSRPSFDQGKPHVAVAYPILDGGNQLEGMLVGLLSLERLFETNTPAAERFRVQVLDRRGLLLLRDTAPGASPRRAASLPSALRPVLSGGGEGVQETFGPDDSRLLAAYAPVTGTAWSVLVTRDLGEAYHPITRTSAAFLALLALGSLLMLGLSQFVARDIIHRLDLLREATASIAKGELGRRVPQEEEDDELGDLCHSFNEMAARTEAAQAELREAVRLREEFLSVASHELRTPLTPLKGFAALTLSRVEKAADFPERERLLKALRSMSRQTDRLHRLVDDLLDTSRIQAGRFELERTRVDLLPLVLEVIERFELRGQDGLRFFVEVPDSPVEGFWDGPRLEQVVTNLLSNAVRYSPQGGTVRVGFHLTSESVELRVRDEGIGIPPESLAALFQPFARASNATSRHFGGLGLGLFICREIVQRHGGTIWAESPGPQQGSCFHVRLPREEAGVLPAAAAS